MRLFLYGTLLDRPTLAHRGGDARLPARATRAALAGWRRVVLGRARVPTLRRAPAGRIDGMLLTPPAAALRRLVAYEGPAYRLRRVVVATARGKTAAFVWIAPGGTRRPWKG